MSWPIKQPRVTQVRALGDYRVELTFNDGAVGELDLSSWIVGQGGAFAPLQDRDFFAQVRVNHEAGTIEWPNNVDFCPDVLYSQATGKPIPFAEAPRETVQR
jgi:hypothetical protein